jgi:hypothetical protein
VLLSGIVYTAVMSIGQKVGIVWYWHRQGSNGLLEEQKVYNEWELTDKELDDIYKELKDSSRCYAEMAGMVGKAYQKKLLEYLNTNYAVYNPEKEQFEIPYGIWAELCEAMTVDIYLKKKVKE